MPRRVTSALLSPQQPSPSFPDKFLGSHSQKEAIHTHRRTSTPKYTCTQHSAGRASQPRLGAGARSPKDR